MYMCVDAYVYTHVHTYIHAYYKYTYMYMYTYYVYYLPYLFHVYIYAYVHVHVHVHVHIEVNISVYQIIQRSWDYNPCQQKSTMCTVVHIENGHAVRTFHEYVRGGPRQEPQR